ncbi:MAG: hypothetical protein ACLS5G_04555 [Streptococcus sp.]
MLGVILLVILAKIASEFFMANYFGSLLFFDSKSVILLVYSYLVTSFIVGVMDILTFRKQNIIALIQENGVKKSVLAKASQFFKHFSLFFRQLLSVLVLSIFQTITIYHS